MRLLIIALLIGLTAVLTIAQIPPRIERTYVQDHANVLTPEDERLIQAQLDQFKQKYNIEFGVATVETTNGIDPFDYSLQMAREYGIGSKEGEKRGLLLFLATKDRKWRTQISQHMENFFTDGQSGEIGRNVLVPKLKIASKSGTSADWRDAILAVVSATDSVIAKAIEPERPSAPATPTDYTGLWIGLGLFGAVGLGIAGGIGISRKRRREREAVIAAEEERQRQIRFAEQEKARKEYEAQAKREAEEREKQRLARLAWLATPEGIAETARIEKERQARLEAARQKQLAHERWLKTPEGIADTKRRLAEEDARRKREKIEAEQRRKREAEEAVRRRKQEEEEEEERRARRRREDSYSSYNSSSSFGNSSSSSSSSNSDSSSSSFGGGGDFSGGGSGGSW